MVEAKQRFFARITALDIACPDCGEVHQFKRNPLRHRPAIYENWNPETALFKCSRCFHLFRIGIAATPVFYLKPGAPADWLPTPEEARALRALGAEGEYVDKQIMSKKNINVIGAKGCSCYTPLGMETCKLHGSPAEVKK